METKKFSNLKKNFLALLMEEETTDISRIIREISAMVTQKTIDEIENGACGNFSALSWKYDKIAPSYSASYRKSLSPRGLFPF